MRKWLTYIALVIAAGVFIGDLIAALTYFLRGETTSRFFAKSSVVLLLSGGVFFYYFGGLRKSEEAGAPGKSRREGWMAVLSAVVVTAMVILGFWQIGAPSTQRTLRADLKRVQDLYQLSSQLHSHWDADKKLPEHLDELSGAAFADPITRMAYEYHPKEGSQYQLCATFSLESPRNEPKSRSDKWSHPAGRYCFSLNATQPNENPNIYLSD